MIPALIERCCPLCGQDAHEPFLTTGDRVFGCPGTFHIVRCVSCEMLYTRPQVAPERIGQFYPQTYAAHMHSDASSRRKERRRDPWDRIEPFGGRRLLDVGCGSGAYLLRQKSRGWNVRGIEPVAGAVTAARGLGLEVEQGAVPGAGLDDGTYDLITMLGAFNHTPEPAVTLAELRRGLAPGGLLIISVFNAASAGARLFGPDWPGWDLPRIVNHFTPQTLRRILSEAGFSDIRILGRRRTSLWRHACRLRAQTRHSAGWVMLSRLRPACSLAATLLGRGEKADEIIAIAKCT